MPQSGFSIGNIVRQWGASRPEAPALTLDATTLRWSQLCDRSCGSPVPCATGKLLKKDLRAPFWDGKERQIG